MMTSLLLGRIAQQLENRRQRKPATLQVPHLSCLVALILRGLAEAAPPQGEQRLIVIEWMIGQGLRCRLAAHAHRLQPAGDSALAVCAGFLPNDSLRVAL